MLCCLPGNNTDAWAVHLQSKQFQLLCSQDSRAEVKDYRHCHLARVPSHAVMVRPQLNIHAIYGLLDKAQASTAQNTHTQRPLDKYTIDIHAYTHICHLNTQVPVHQHYFVSHTIVCVCEQEFYGSDLSPGFQMFDSAKYGDADLLFKDSTVRVIGVGERRTYEEWLGQEYLDSLLAMDCPASAAGVCVCVGLCTTHVSQITNPVITSLISVM